MFLEHTGCPRKNYLLGFYISIIKKATKKIIVWPEGGKNPDRFEYRTASEQYLVAEICRVEVTEPRNEKILVKNIYFVSLQ